MGSNGKNVANELVQIVQRYLNSICFEQRHLVQTFGQQNKTESFIKRHYGDFAETETDSLAGEI